MEKFELDFLNILKNAIHPDASFTIDNPDWTGIMNTARKQNLLSFVFDASQGLPGYEAIEAQYFAPVAAQVAQQAQKTADFLKLYKAFISDGISPIILKGIICRGLYGDRADLRPSGDEDILIERKDYDKAQKILNLYGYYSKKKLDKSIDGVHEITFYGDNLTIELHFTTFGKETATRDRMNEWFNNVFDSDEWIAVDDVPLRMMHPTEYLLFLIFHAYKHFSFAGFGVRMMMDVLLFTEKYWDQIDWNHLYGALKEVGTCDFYSDLIEIGDQYLGFCIKRQYPVKCPDELLEDMLTMGTFGNSSTVDWVAGKIVVDKIQMVDKDNNHNKGKLHSFVRLLFPSWKTWISSRPYLKDKPLMVIPEWFKRVGRYLRHETSVGNLSEINESYEIAEHRLELLKKYGVI